MNAALPFTVGWELEFALRDPIILNRVHRAVSEAGYSAENYARYRHTPPTTDRWDLKTDSSCGVAEGVVGYEAVSPVISSYPELCRHAHVANIIQASGGLVNERCGFHVHLGFREHYSAENIELLFRFLHRYEQAFYLLVPPSRRRNIYCKPMPQQIVDSIHRHHGQIDVPAVWRDKNTWVNFITLGRIGTVEFRLMPGTLVREQIVGFVMFLQHVMETIIRGRKEVQWGKASARDDRMMFLTMLQQAGFYGKDVVDPDRAALGRTWAQRQFKWANSPEAARIPQRHDNSRAMVEEFVPRTPRTPSRRTQSRRPPNFVSSEPAVTHLHDATTASAAGAAFLTQDPVDERPVGGVGTFSLFDDSGPES